jgi:hypothetical protein
MTGQCEPAARPGFGSGRQPRTSATRPPPGQDPASWKTRPATPKRMTPLNRRNPLSNRPVSAQVVQSTAQWGGRTPKAGGRELDGRTWDQVPAAGAGKEAAP